MRKGELKRSILLAAGAGVLLGASVVFPGLPIALNALLRDLEKEGKKVTRGKVERTLRTLQKRKIVSLKEKDGELYVIFTQKGKKEILKYKLDELKIKEPKVWDGKWRVVIFDIPEKKKLAREILRGRLKQLEFYPLQKSVFVHPFDCQREMELLKNIYKVGSFVHLILADYIDKEEKLLRHFGL